MTNNKKLKDLSNINSIKDALKGALDCFSYLSETDVKIILSTLNDIPYNEFVFHFEDKLKDVDTFIKICERVNSGYPLQYALNSTEFCGLNLYVDERVLIPRQETEELVLFMNDLILREDIKEPVIADICTGSGAIALSLKHRVSASKIYGTDISFDALEVAKKNKASLGLDVTFLEGDSLVPLIENNIKVDYLVANPPYVNLEDEVQDNVRQYEPHLALFSNDKSVYWSIFKNIDKVMKRDEIVMMLEINDKEGELTKDIALKALGTSIDVRIIKDINKRDRFVLIRYKKWKQN